MRDGAFKGVQAHGHAVLALQVLPRRYVASVAELRQSKPEVSVLLLTGEAYEVSK